ncbi:hypothetical protein BJ994_002549 [Arthrobacter pigmenti]|uniref:DUF5655 domain-containing protein n=1 Tax=Arthrobacter pigmenti TaxID=271432 RepID=A0A846RJQ9_9MICC|nr:hypothetical protein [Arthrobacter pigmenti]NJC23473.1 hypothetical protein [Arthrobacter pigmenti]
MAEMKSWQSMVESNKALLLRTTGHDVGTWVERARVAGVDSREALLAWLASQDITGYSAIAVEWELLGYPETFLRSAEELLAGQYADRPALRPTADRVLAWAVAAENVEIQLRKTYASLQTPRRKFAQLTPTNKTTVDLFFRTAIASEPRLEALTPRADDPFRYRVRLKSENDVDDALLATLNAARDESL